MASSPESTPAKREKTKSLSRQKSSALPWAQQGGEVWDWVSPGHNQDELFWEERSKIVHTVLCTQIKSGTHTHLFAPCDELFVVRSGELRMQCHDLESNKWDDSRRQTPRQRDSHFIQTYFDGTVKVLVEALSRVETNHLNLQHRHQRENKGELLRNVCFNCCLCNYLWPPGGTVRRGKKKKKLEWIFCKFTN